MEKLLPQNIEAEQGVLGSILIDPDAIVALDDVHLHPEDFYRTPHQHIYQAIQTLREEGEPSDFITVCDVLERRKELQAVGGMSYVTSLVNCVPTSGNIEYYARIVKRASLLRQWIGFAGKMAALAYEDSAPDVIQRQAESFIFKMSQEQHTGGDFRPISELVAEYMTQLEEHYQYLKDQGAIEQGLLLGVPTGFRALDLFTGGFQKSELILLAAQTSHGKTSFALSLIHNVALQYGKSVGVFSLEMSDRQLTQRLLSMTSQVDLHRMKRVMLAEKHWEQLVKGMGELSDGKIFIADTTNLTPEMIRSKGLALKVKHGLDLLVIDYIGLMGNGKDSENRVREMDEISRKLKLLAVELDIPILALAQLNRAVNTRQVQIPRLSDLRDSGSLEQNANQVWFIYRPDYANGYYDPKCDRHNEADIIIAKNRDGEVGQTTVYFHGQYTRFSDVRQEEPTHV